MDQENPFLLPDDYFRKLEDRISAQTSESLLERFRHVLTDMEAAFRVPAYYFPAAQAALLNRLEESRQAIQAWTWQDVLKPALACSLALLLSLSVIQKRVVTLDQQIARIPPAEIENYLVENSNLINIIPDDPALVDHLFKPTAADSSQILSDADILDEVSYELL